MATAARAMAKGGNFGWARLLSGMSGWTLAVCGALSLLVSLLVWSWLGIAMGVALLIHGIVELRLRRRFLAPGGSSAARGMGWNQLALAATVGLYVAWQATHVDHEALARAASSDLVATLSELYGIDAAEALREQAPRMVAGFYVVVGVVVALGCLGTALVYWRAGRRKAATEVPPPL